MACHVHVDTGRQRAEPCVFRVRGKAVRHQVADRIGVAHDESLEAPRLAQHVPQQELVRGGWHVVQVHVRAHERGGALVGGRLERRQVDVPHLIFRNEDGLVIPAALGRAIAREVLRAGQHAVGLADVLALESAHLRPSDCGAQIRIFARALDEAAPTRVARDVHHGREGPVNAGCACLARGHALRALHQCGIPGCGHGHRDREDGFETVDHIEPEDRRDVQARLLDCDLLQAVDRFRI